MKEIAPDHTHTEQAEGFLFALRLKKGIERLEEENKQRITPKEKRIVSKLSDKDYFKSPILPPPAVSEKIGRNDPCPCGSGKKFKKCCMK